jgi:hypothetical protein
MSVGQRLFAALYDRMNAAAERRWMGERWANLLADAHGLVLEIGSGTGANLPYYRDVERLVIAEPDPFMRKNLFMVGISTVQPTPKCYRYICIFV